MAMTLRARLTIWYAGILFVVLALFGFSVQQAAARLLLNDLDTQLRREAASMSLKIATELDEGNDLDTGAHESYPDFSAPGWFLSIYDAQGRLLVGPPDGPPTLPKDLVETRDAFKSATVMARGAEYQALAARGTHPGGAWRVVVMAPLQGIRRQIGIVRQSLLIGIPMATVLAVLGGLAIARRALRPLTRMATEAKGVAAPVPGFRLGVPGPADELSVLARSFNGLLEKLDLALHTQRQFMADAAHELRTPVSIVRTTAEVTLGAEKRSDAEYRDALSVVSGQAGRLGKMVDDMMTLSRADAGGLLLQPVTFYFDELIQDCLRDVSSLGARQGVSLSSSTGAEVSYCGDEALLRRMLLNLLHNAIEHTPSGGRVSVTLKQTDDAVELAVEDTGVGVAAEERERIFDRFVRIDPSRTRAGAGLGLPIARTIAQAHGGTLVLAARESLGGSSFVVRLPRHR